MNLNRIYEYKIFNYNPFTPVYGLARAALAMGTLITILFNDINMLFDKDIFVKLSEIDSHLIKLNLFNVFGYDNLVFSKFLAVSILLIVIIGYFPRYTGILHWWVAFSYNSFSILIDGGDQLTSVLTFLLIPITILDNRKNHWNLSTSKKTVNTLFIANSFFFIISIQMATVYLQAAVEKLYKLNEWVSGTALYYYMNDPLFGSPSWLLNVISPLLNSKLIFFLSWSVILLELLLFSALFMNKKNKVVLFYFAVLFHTMIIINFGLFSFFFAMLGVLIIYLLPKNIQIQKIISPLKLTRNINTTGNNV